MRVLLLVQWLIGLLFRESPASVALPWVFRFNPMGSGSIRGCEWTVQCPKQDLDQLHSHSTNNLCEYTMDFMPQAWENCILSVVADGDFGEIQSERIPLVFQDVKLAIVLKPIPKDMLGQIPIKKATLEFHPLSNLALVNCQFSVRCSQQTNMQYTFGNASENRCEHDIYVPVEWKECVVHAKAWSNHLDEIKSEVTPLDLNGSPRLRLVPIEPIPPVTTVKPSSKRNAHIQDLHLTWNRTHLILDHREPQNPTVCGVEIHSPETRIRQRFSLQPQNGLCRSEITVDRTEEKCTLTIKIWGETHNQVQYLWNICHSTLKSQGSRYCSPTSWFILLAMPILLCIVQDMISII